MARSFARKLAICGLLLALVFVGAAFAQENEQAAQEAVQQAQVPEAQQPEPQAGAQTIEEAQSEVGETPELANNEQGETPELETPEDDHVGDPEEDLPDHEGDEGDYEHEDQEGEGEDEPDDGEYDEESGEGTKECKASPENNLPCGGPERGECNKHAGVCLCHETDEEHGWFGDSCECGFAQADCNPQHCFWCESVKQCVLDKRDCDYLNSKPMLPGDPEYDDSEVDENGEMIHGQPMPDEQEEGVEGQEGGMEQPHYDAEGNYVDEGQMMHDGQPNIDVTAENGTSSSTAAILFCLLIVGGGGVAYYVLKVRGGKFGRSGYGRLRADEL